MGPVEQYRTRYWDFNGQALSTSTWCATTASGSAHTWTKIRLQEAGLVNGSGEGGERGAPQEAAAQTGLAKRDASCSRTARPTAGWWIWAKATSTSSPTMDDATGEGRLGLTEWVEEEGTFTSVRFGKNRINSIGWLFAKRCICFRLPQVLDVWACSRRGSPRGSVTKCRARRPGRGAS